MADDSNNSRTPIIVAMIGCAATIAVGVLANWDKVFTYTNRVPAVIAANNADRAQAGMAGPVTGGSVAAAAEPADDAGQTAASPSIDHPAPAEPGSAATSPSPGAGAGRVAGSWRDGDGFTYRFTVTGNRIAYTQHLAADGAQVGSGSGTIAGRALSYRYLDDRTGGSGTCKGELTGDGGAIEGRCASGDDSWPFRIDRVAG